MEQPGDVVLERRSHRRDEKEGEHDAKQDEARPGKTLRQPPARRVGRKIEPRVGRISHAAAAPAIVGAPLRDNLTATIPIRMSTVNRSKFRASLAFSRRARTPLSKRAAEERASRAVDGMKRHCYRSRIRPSLCETGHWEAGYGAH